MSQPPYTVPSFEAKAFNCPLCDAFSKQDWYYCAARNLGHTAIARTYSDYYLSHCSCCLQFALWDVKFKTIVYPISRPPIKPNPDLPPEIQKDFIEATIILKQSPRGACALFRLCIQKLCKHLGESGENINRDIGNLVAKGLSAQIQRSLDVVRVVGNNAVHPGQIDVSDGEGAALALGRLINLITDALITQPKLIDQLYTDLPESALEAIAKRDAPKK